MVWPDSFQVADAGALVFRVGGILFGVSEHFGEGHFHMLLHCGQVEVPVQRQHYNPRALTAIILEEKEAHLVLKYISVVSRVEGE